MHITYQRATILAVDVRNPVPGTPIPPVVVDADAVEGAIIMS